jgi:hypothetical protein
MGKWFVETDWERNIRRVSPFLGVLLVASFALFMFMMLHGALSDLTTSIAAGTDTTLGAAGTLRLASSQPVRYGATVQLQASVTGARSGAATYITVVCFQGDKLVYQRSAPQGTSFLIAAQYDRDITWDGGPASCSAALMYRTGGSSIDVHVLDAVSFDVSGRAREG